jgi:hypothetical protein
MATTKAFSNKQVGVGYMQIINIKKKLSPKTNWCMFSNRSKECKYSKVDKDSEQQIAAYLST